MGKKLSAIILAGAMMLTMGATAFAAGDNVPAVDTNGKAYVTKDFVMAEGIAVPTADFQFTVTKITADAPAASVQDISYSSADTGTAENGKYTVSKNSEIVFEAFPHAGVYEYTVQETAGKTAGVTYSNRKYTLKVYVVNNPDGSLSVKSITADNGTAKQEKILFTNTYVKNSSLIIEKKTTGSMADKTKEFNFSITFHKSPTSESTSFVGTVGQTQISCQDGAETAFTLHDSQQLEFKDIPAGTRYVVKELGVSGDGYTPNVTVVENGTVTVSAKQGTEADDLASSETGKTNLIGEGANKVTFENKHNDVPVTGIIMHNLPFIIVICIALVGLGALTVIKKRRAAKR